MLWRTLHVMLLYDDDLPDLSHISLSNAFDITLMDMDNQGISMSGNPLVIINACETGNLNPLYTGHFASNFLRYGARGVVATECIVPDKFAAAFAQHLYCHLLDGTSLR